MTSGAVVFENEKIIYYIDVKFLKEPFPIEENVLFYDRKNVVLYRKHLTLHLIMSKKKLVSENLSQ